MRKKVLIILLSLLLPAGVISVPVLAASRNPEAAQTVTGNVTYTAKWEKEKPQPTGDETPMAAAVSAALAAGAIIVFTLRRRKIRGTK